MRIGLFNSTPSELASEVSSQPANTQSGSKTSQSGAEDRTTLTSSSTSVDSLVSTALQSPEVRLDKVESLRQAVNSGQYKLEPSAIAASMIDDYA